MSEARATAAGGVLVKAVNTMPGGLACFYLALVIIGSVAAVYHHTRDVPLVLDDHSSIVNNVSIRRWWPPEPAEIGGTRGRPVANATFALNYRWGGQSPAGYHLVNTVIHAAAALVLFGLVRRTLLFPAGDEARARSADFVAGIAALIWAVHPLHTAAVTYLSQRTESLMGFFYLATLYCFARGIASHGKARTWHALAVLTCLAGMATKEVMVTAPLAVLLYDRAFGVGRAWLALRTRPGFYSALFSSWLVLALLMSGMGQRGVGFNLGMGPMEYALTESWVLLKYLKLAVWPAPLIFDYGPLPPPSWAEVWPSLTVLGVALPLLFAALWFHPKRGLLLAWPLLLLSPTSSFVPVALQPIAEHRMYLPLAGLAVAAVLVSQLIGKRRLWLPALFVVAALGTLTYRRNATYASDLTLWTDTVRQRPDNDRAHVNLGLAYLARGDAYQARHHFERAMALNPHSAEAWSNLGYLQAQSGRAVEAVAFFQRALELSPGAAELYYNLGCALLSTGDLRAAGAAFSQAILLHPKHAGAHNNLGIVLASAGKAESAVAHFSAALRVTPRDGEVYANRGDAYLQLGRDREARGDYETAAELRPDLERVRASLEKLQGAARR